MKPPDGIVGGLGAAPATVGSPARRGVLDALPLVAGYLPFALVLGATIAAGDVPDLAGWASSGLMFAGAAQLATIELLDAGAASAIIVATALVINLRHVMYSGALAPYFRSSPVAWRVTAPHLLADPVYSLAAVRFPELPDERSRRVYYAALGLSLFCAWQVMTGFGVLLGGQLPSGPGLELAVPLIFLALLVPTVKDRPTLAAAVVGGGVTVAAQGLPLHLGLIVGALAGVVAGLLSDKEVRTCATGR